MDEGDGERVEGGESCCRNFQNRRPSKTSGLGKYRSSDDIPASGVRTLVPDGRWVPSDKSIGFMTLRMKEAMVVSSQTWASLPLPQQIGGFYHLLMLLDSRCDSLMKLSIFFSLPMLSFRSQASSPANTSTTSSRRISCIS